MDRYVLDGEVPWLDDADLDLGTAVLDDGVFAVAGSIDGPRRRLRKTRVPIRLVFRHVSAVAIDDSQRLGRLVIDTIRRTDEPPGFLLSGPIPGSIAIATPDAVFEAERARG